MPDLDIVGTAAVDVVPIAPEFHAKLKAIVLPAADRVGEEAGRRLGDAMSRHIVVAIPSAVNRGGAAAARAASRQGDDAGGAFARSLRRKLEVAFKAMPKLNVRLSDTGVDAQLTRLRARMETLSRKTIGIDIDAGAAEAEIIRIDAELKRLGASHTDVNVRADTATARAALAQIRAEIAAVDAHDPRIHVDLDSAAAEGALLRLAVALGVVAAIPIAPPIVAGLGAILAAATAAGAGVAAVGLAAIPAIKGVTEVIRAKSAAEKEATSATNNSSAAGVKATQRALQMASAQQALTSAHRNAARSIAQANRQVEDAERAVAQAAQRAADQRRQAAENVERAERSLADAQRSARQAEEALTQARRDAAQQLKDLNDQLADGALDQRDATLRVQEAQLELQRTMSDPRASELQQQRAQLAYDQAVQAAKEQKQDYADLQKEAEKQRKAGVDGNADVKRAAQALSDAQRNVRDQTKAVADAHREAARAAVDAAQTVADAQRTLSDAVENAANTQVQAAESVASAERGVESARLSGMSATSGAISKSAEYRKALAKLTPEQRALYDSIAGPKGLTSAFKAWAKELQPDVLPLFTRGVNGAKTSLPGLTPLVRTSADAIGELMDAASEELKSPFWRDFKKDIQTSAKPAIIGLGKAFGNVLKGMAGVIDAFLPHMDGISKTMQRITGRFADWGKNLKGSPEFERFLQYVKDTSPGLAEFLGKMLTTALDLAQALAPLSQGLFDVLSPLLDGLSWIAKNVPEVIQYLWTLYITSKLLAVGMRLAAVGIGLYNTVVALAAIETWSWAAAIQATGIVPLIELIVVAVITLGFAVYTAYKRVGWFRTAVDASWAGIKTATIFLWEKILKPAFAGLWIAIKAVGDVAVWLWKNAIQPAFQGIWLVARILVAVLVTVVFTPLLLLFKLVGLLAVWLWTDCFKPTFEAAAWLATWLWKNALKPAFDGIWWLLQWVGDKFVWLYDHGVKPPADFIAEKSRWLWRKALKPVFDAIWGGLKVVGDKFVWLYDHGVKPTADFIAGKNSWLYKQGVKPAFDKIKSALSLVVEAFEAAKKGIGIAWNKVRDITKGPVNFLIDFVYSKGIKAVWDKVAGYVGLDPLPKAPKLLEAGGTVGDGWGIARPLKTNKPTAIVGEGNPRYPEYVIPTDPKYRARALSLHQAAGTQLLEGGGILGGLDSAWDWTKDKAASAVNKGIDWSKAATDVLTDPAKLWNSLTAPILSKVSKGVGSSLMGKAVGKYPRKMVSGLRTKIVDAVSSMFPDGGGGGGIWAKPVNVPYGTPFGKRGSMWSSGRHTGLDFPAPTGTPVHAVANGKVTLATGGGPYGNHVIVNHGGGLSSLYAHMSRILTSVGDAVKQGQTIGKVGATGNVTGPHLHLEARRNGVPVDPMGYLSGGARWGATARGAAQAYAKSILGNYGWGQNQFGPLQKLWQGESGWNYRAKNPSSGAYGIPQALPASKMASAGSDWLTNYKTQIRWGLGYIKGRPDYGSPAAAYSKWLARSPHWYDEGGYLPPGLNLVANGTGKPEPVFTSGQWDTLRAAQGGGAPTEIHADVRVFVGDREITDIVRTEVQARESSTASAIDNGRWG
ncbi:peptidoglycan DD-metalloendopeptidase family protein [Streptomyces sp. NPDC002952]|uniref:aggregation-promoting factor C-terminal-like domain-containing protein n=1 Tax=Streptomyces sp. NPDC002952 TaxID=3364673 RepID=UPI00369FC219